MAPGMATGTLLASLDGDAIGGRPGAAPSDLSLINSSDEGFGLGSLGCLLSARRTDGEDVGEGLGFAWLSSGVLPFSSSASLPTSFDDVRATSFSAANTD